MFTIYHKIFNEIIAVMLSYLVAKYRDFGVFFGVAARLS